MKSTCALGALMILAIATFGCRQSGAEYEIARAAAGLGSYETTESLALVTEHQHGRTIWTSQPATVFYQLHPDGTAAEIPDPVMEPPAIWEDLQTMRKAFPHCQAPLLPPMGGAAKLILQDPQTWDHLGCVKQRAWHNVLVAKSDRGVVIGPFPKGAGRQDKFYVVVAAQRWRNSDVPAPPAQNLAQLPKMLMGK